MSFWSFLLILVTTTAAAGWVMYMLLRGTRTRPDPAPSSEPTLVLPPRARVEIARFDARDTVPEDATLADLLAARPGPGVLPDSLPRRAERLRERSVGGRDEAPMRALALLLIDTIDAGLPDPFEFHDGARIFLSTASAPVLAEFAAEAEQRIDALGPWLDQAVSTTAITVARTRAPGALDGLAARIEARQQQISIARLDGLLVSIGAAAARGDSAAVDSLQLASFVGRHPEFAQRAMIEMASHPFDPIWTAARLNMEQRLLAIGQLSNTTAFRSRVMDGLQSDNADLLDAAAEAAIALMDAEAAGDVNTLWSAAGGALARVSRIPPGLGRLADRLGLARPDPADTAP